MTLTQRQPAILTVGCNSTVKEGGKTVFTEKIVGATFHGAEQAIGGISS
ncbi:hypothetical protein [Saccharomonospora marina]|nr:hypothetical protein [Saccharomonospora marina]